MKYEVYRMRHMTNIKFCFGNKVILWQSFALFSFAEKVRHFGDNKSHRIEYVTPLTNLLHCFACWYCRICVWL